MRRYSMIVSLILFPALASAATIRGAWHLSQDDGHLQLDMNTAHHQNNHSIAPEAFQGLSAGQLNSSTEVPAKFQLVREAGTFDFTGSFLNGDGVGRFAFSPDSSYSDRLRTLGVESSELTDDRLFSLALLDVSSAFIREMQSLGYRESLDHYLAFRIHGANPDFVRALQALGYTNVSADQLLAFRIHGVTPGFIRDLKAAGYSGIPADQLVAFRIHGVTAEFARDMRDMNVSELDPEQLVAMRIHGVSSEYVRELRDLGYRSLSSEQLIAMRIHGVTTQFVRELAEAGYHNVPPEKLVSMRIHGIDADFVRKVK